VFRAGSSTVTGIEMGPILFSSETDQGVGKPLSFFLFFLLHRLRVK
jgi:hypothetical protein